jgi:hypothetical protein
MQQALSRVPAGASPLDTLSPVEVGTLIAETTIANFRRTASQYQANQGWGLGALVAFVSKDEPQLIEFDGIQFHPEIKGIPDPARENRVRVWRATSMGGNQTLSDSFLAHAYRVLFGDRPTRVDRAKLVVSWTLDHVIRYNVGGIGGEQQIAVLEKSSGGAWEAHHIDAKGELREQVDALEAHISSYGREVEQPESQAALREVIATAEEPAAEEPVQPAAKANTEASAPEPKG